MCLLNFLLVFHEHHLHTVVFLHPKRDFTNYEIATKLTAETMEIRVATLLSCIGSDAMNIFDGLTMTDTERKQIPAIFQAFEKYCVGETNET